MTVFLRASDNTGKMDFVDYEDLRVPLWMYKNDFVEKLSFMKWLEQLWFVLTQSQVSRGFVCR